MHANNHVMLKHISLLPVLILCFCICVSADTPAHPIKKVILISIDTLRADYLGCYNPKAKATPEIDHFAANNILCKDVTSQSATTAPSHKSIFYSLYPSIHKTSMRGIPKETAQSPVEVIQSNGFRTAAFTGGGQLSHSFGFARGFETYWEPKTDPFVKHQTEEMQSAAFSWLEHHSDEPFFLFLHTYEVHCPYSPPPAFFQKWAAWYDGPVKDTCYPSVRLGRRLSPVDFEYIRSLYSAEVNYIDFFIGQLLQKLKTLKIYDETAIIFLADHGESLGEQGYIGHNQLHQVQLHVPLILHLPGIQSMKINAPLESIDVMPTIFDVLPIASRPTVFQGKSILPLIRNPKTFDQNRPLISEEPGQVRVKINRYAAIFSQDGSFADRLYDMQSDPLELQNIAAKNTQLIQKMKLPYFEMIARTKNLSDQFVLERGQHSVVDEHTQEQLQSLGYVSH
jgi:arylsulfatase